MDAEAETMGGASPPGVRRACDQCRLRKIRCDKETPCSNCRSAKRSCSSTGLGQKPKEPRQRVLISSQYEKKIDFMGDRLATIEALLRDLSTSPRPANNSSLASSSNTPSDQDRRARQQNNETPTTTPGGASDNLSPSKTPYDDTSTVFEPDDSETFEGSTSLAAHAAFASDFVATASIAVAPFSGSNPRMEAALSSLKQMVELQNSRTGPGSTTSYFDGTTSTARAATAGKHRSGKGYVRLKDLPMPPMELVISELRELQSAPGSMMLLVVTCFTDQEVFVERCRRLYFHTDHSDIPEALFLNVNAGLIYLFFEKSIRAPAGTAAKATLEKCTAMCQLNMETAIAQLPLLLPATLENCEALLMGASFAVDVSRPSLAWLLTERAANMCRTLGLHQEHTLRGDPPELRRTKALVFWSAYMLDKGLSLRLGRASVLQDYDIGVPSVLERTALDDTNYGGVAGSGHSTAILSLWIKHAEVQGRIYQRLYSPGALRQAGSTRAAQVHAVIADLQFLLRETNRLLEEAAARAGAAGTSDEVGYWSSAALAYRALPPSTTNNGGGGGGGGGAGDVSGAAGGKGNKSRTFADECTDAARAAMRSHQECMDMMNDTSLKVIYLHWTILYAPFIPFIVIFCQVIENAGSDASTSDLRHLERFIQSLEAGCGISPAVEKLHRLSTVLYNVALLYAEAKAQQAWDQDMVPVGNEFDLYLSQLGIMPMDESGGSGSTDPTGAGNDVNGAGAGAGGGGSGTDDIMRNVQLGDWFSGNNHILGLVEEDLSSFNTSMW
ncbi:hypothetical protein PG993_011844 [Apiospora rasikravindrae]|uniref:Zn(2)-C6 fungal-type domain-containing protein n=1 Tax=Apiospora rasikravindrae TaxID=990691 RepID=A0ABR1S0V5_9PEZI